MSVPNLETSSTIAEVRGSVPVRVAAWVKKFKWPLLASLALVVSLYARVFTELASDWWSDSNYSHGFLVPVAFAWIIWQRRSQLAQTRVAPVSWGLLVVAVALLQLMAGQLGAEYFVTRTSLLVLLLGITMFLLGMEALRRVLFPVGLLIFMIPLPAIIFYAATFPLQLLASRMAAELLDLLRIPNLREGNILYLPNFTVGVVEACSGIRSLISLVAFTVFLGHLRSMNWVGRCVLVALAVPVALCANTLRVVGTGVAGNYWGARWAEGFFHTFSGWVLFLGALVAVFAAAEILIRWGSAHPRAVA